MNASYTIFDYQTSDIVRFKGALVDAIGREHSIFHNHDLSRDGKHIAGYQKIQYRLQSIDGQNHIAIYAIGEGVKLLDHLVNEGIHIHPNSSETKFELKRKVATQYFRDVCVGYSEEPILYLLKRYIPLNNTDKDNKISSIDKYKTLLTEEEKKSYIEEQLEKHILSVAHFLNCRLNDRPRNKIKIIGPFLPENVYIHYNNFQLDLVIQTFISLPELISIGNIRAENKGVLHRLGY